MLSSGCHEGPLASALYPRDARARPNTFMRRDGGHLHSDARLLGLARRSVAPRGGACDTRRAASSRQFRTQGRSVESFGSVAAGRDGAGCRVGARRYRCTGRRRDRLSRSRAKRAAPQCRCRERSDAHPKGPGYRAQLEIALARERIGSRLREAWLRIHITINCLKYSLDTFTFRVLRVAVGQIRGDI